MKQKREITLWRAIFNETGVSNYIWFMKWRKHIKCFRDAKGVIRQKWISRKHEKSRWYFKRLSEVILKKQ